jgi:hypothetical protein
MPIIAPRWIAPDGRSFHIVWSDLQTKGDPAELDRSESAATKMSPAERARAIRKLMPYYGFNVQRVDLIVK